MFKREYNEEKSAKNIAKFYVSQFGKNALEEFIKMNVNFLEHSFFESIIGLIME